MDSFVLKTSSGDNQEQKKVYVWADNVSVLTKFLFDEMINLVETHYSRGPYEIFRREGLILFKDATFETSGGSSTCDLIFSFDADPSVKGIERSIYTRNSARRITKSKTGVVCSPNTLKVLSKISAETRAPFGGSSGVSVEATVYEPVAARIVFSLM